MRRIASLALTTITAISLLAGCAALKRDRCYLAETRYMAMRAIFEETGSYQRAAQAMDDAQWSHCEVNTFRYRLRKDLGLADREYDPLFVEREPSRKGLGYNPGRVEKAVY